VSHGAASEAALPFSSHTCNPDFLCYFSDMKAEIHPNYHSDAKVTCACGASFPVGSTRESIDVEICSSCHPFYTGGEKLMDTAGRVERFKARATASAAKKTAPKASK
jgi:large subunit ribosomal protein L31